MTAVAHPADTPAPETDTLDLFHSPAPPHRTTGAVLTTAAPDAADRPLAEETPMANATTNRTTTRTSTTRPAPTPSAAGDATIPVVLSGQALRSLRDSGYDLPTAVAEVVDNSIEAAANTVTVRLDEEAVGRKKRIHRIVIADDGRGMDPFTLHHYLQLGFSTRYMSQTTIGKYGVGAKLAAFNFAECIQVWSRHAADAPWLYVGFDLEAAMNAEQDGGPPLGIAAPKPHEVPGDLADLLPAGTGTLVVWSKVDRLEDGRWAENANKLRLEMQSELSRIYRRFIHGGISIVVNGTALLPHDPTFLMEGTWADARVRAHLVGAGASPADMPAHFPAALITEENLKVGGAEATLRVTLYPPEVTRKRGMGGDELAKEIRLPENEGAISFVRLDREISYTNVPRIFPRGVDRPDRFIGIEVEFTPAHDEYFGVRNVKRGVEPHDQLRAEIKKRLEKAVPLARAILDERWGEVSRADKEYAGEHIAVTEAAQAATRTMPKPRVADRGTDDDLQRELEQLAKDAGHVEPSDRDAYIARVRDLPFVIESVDWPGTNFVELQHVAGKVILRMNARHRFYREVWEPLKRLGEPGAAATTAPDEVARVARRAIEGLDLLFMAYGHAESMHDNPDAQYGDLRAYWGQFLGTLLTKVKDVV